MELNENLIFGMSKRKNKLCDEREMTKLKLINGHKHFDQAN
jgi:hypothetical protein